VCTVTPITLLSQQLKPYETVAELIKESCAGIGTNELLLMSSIIRYQAILPDVMTAHEELFGKSLHDRVRSETRSDFEKVLVEILDNA